MKQYKHARRRNPERFYKKTFRTVSAKRAGVKTKKRGVKAIVGRLKHPRTNERNWEVQTVLYPKPKREWKKR